ncbi:MAG: hypothetical protein AB7S26_20490 [Sandaracinaceae bacterium]
MTKLHRWCATSAISFILSFGLSSLSACDGGVLVEPDAGSVGDDAGARADAGPGGTFDAGQPDRWLDAAVVDGGGELPDAGGEARVGVLVGQGYAGRTLISCDDGRTWHADHVRDPTIARCFGGVVDCDHTPWTPKGIAYGEGGFAAVWGWGSDDGAMEWSDDGATWTHTGNQARPNFGGIARAHEGFVAARRTGSMSTPDGITWSDAGPLPNYAQVSLRYVGGADGLVFAYGDGNGMRDLMVSDDDGASWHRPTLPDPRCTSRIQNQGGVVGLGGVMVVAGGAGVACASTNGGQTWRATSMASDFSSTLAVRDGEAWIYSRGHAHHSADGVSWTTEETTPSDLDIGAIGVTASGTVVGGSGRRFDPTRWYDAQVMWRAEDGVHFTPVPDDAIRGGHALRFFAYGEVVRPAACDEAP